MRATMVLCAMLAGCAAQTVTVPREVKVEVPTACVDHASKPQRPALRTQAELLAMPQGVRTLAAWADLKAYEAYSAELEAVVEGCSRIPNASAAGGSPGGVGGDSLVKPAAGAP